MHAPSLHKPNLKSGVAMEHSRPCATGCRTDAAADCVCPTPCVLFPLSYSLCLTPCGLFPMSYSPCSPPCVLRPLPYSLCPVPYHLCPINRKVRIRHTIDKFCVYLCRRWHRQGQHHAIIFLPIFCKIPWITLGKNLTTTPKKP